MSDGGMLVPAGPQARILAEQLSTAMIVCTIAFLIAMACLAAALWWRGRRAVADGWWLWGGGIVLPVLVFGGLLLHSERQAAQLDAPAPPDALQVSVTGHLWWWSMRYADADEGPGFTTANELRVPVGRPVRLTLTSDDVIHSFWVPALGGKMDLVPGRLNRLTFTADRPGVFRGPCAEYCGTQHAGMVLHVVAMPPEAFARWRAAQAAARPPPTTPTGLRGSHLFSERGCAACHAVRGRLDGPRESLGPDLTHVAGRLWLGAGTLRNDTPHAALRRWIADVHQVKPGARMPGYGHLPADEVDALARYLIGDLALQGLADQEADRQPDRQPDRHADPSADAAAPPSAGFKRGTVAAVPVPSLTPSPIR
ncbi:cytochrome c oxidase subunit II [Roseateles amylovorans]|uniref:Cytochrome aa3 subunit 2 n=1 Tax=Roseateles amylovorans TaxID=2978473 RepID=A0ABY6BC13_9BURK|nr:cytochrome c oxidase subunit II [Roseateles amylovorans]UXH80737.1 cytochrome c oxidase subunit II [Roseateles amylovorans]